MNATNHKPAWKKYRWRDSRERILIGAAVAFSRKGYYGTSLREISYEAGLEQPSIYHHFGNKEKLYWTALRATHLYMVRQIRRRIAHQESLAEEIRAMFQAISWFQKEYPEFFSLLFSLVYSSPPAIANRYTRRYGGDLAHFVERAFRRHPPPTGYREKLSLTVHTLSSYILSFSGARPEKLRLSYYQALRRFLVSR
ncbi:MAG: TetR/AcrR family transcriptional regulator [Turneriella sp.]|nr:TetR/AcrR family transcriptional regulator [Leptospiraceae bacterium]MCX7631974.1 TetR/AcrR family transcriptional regulator [Turneriella sp.]